MSRVSGAAEQVRVMILRGEIGLGEPTVDERLRETLKARAALEGLSAGLAAVWDRPIHAEVA
jgi:hypothetical protein